MKKFMAILLALALTALMPAAFAQAADDFGYVDRFTLKDGTELPVTVEHKTNWEYQTYQDTLVAEDIPVYTMENLRSGSPRRCTAMRTSRKPIRWIRLSMRRVSRIRASITLPPFSRSTITRGNCPTGRSVRF